MEIGGMIVQRSGGGGLVFVPADVALALVDLGAFTRVPGLLAPASGVAVAEGDVVAVFDISGDGEDAPPSTARGGPQWPVPGGDRAILCDLGGQRVALEGGAVVETGIFEATGEGHVSWRDQRVPRLDVGTLVAQAEAALWAAHAMARTGAKP